MAIGDVVKQKRKILQAAPEFSPNFCVAIANGEVNWFVCIVFLTLFSRGVAAGRLAND